MSIGTEDACGERATLMQDTAYSGPHRSATHLECCIVLIQGSDTGILNGLEQMCYLWPSAHLLDCLR